MEPGIKKIIIADTNWWVSLIIKKFENKFASIITYPNLKFISSEELVREIQSTLSKARIQKYLDNVLLEEFWLLYNSLVVTIKISSSVNICRDARIIISLRFAKIPMQIFLQLGIKIY